MKARATIPRDQPHMFLVAHSSQRSSALKHYLCFGATGPCSRSLMEEVFYAFLTATKMGFI